MTKTTHWNDPIHPGEILAEELEYIGVNGAALAEHIGVPKNRMYGILKGQRSVTADTAIRLGAFFGMTPKFWLNLQKSYELDVALKQASKTVKNIQPYRAAVEHRPQ